MNRKRAIRLVGGAMTIVVAGAAVLAVSGASHGFETRSPGTALTLPVPQAETHILVAQADAAATPVSYSTEQADRGEEDYEDNCTECHGEDLSGGLLGGAPLKGLSFEEKYANGAPAGLLFEVMQTTMPPNAPGRYSASTYADLMAYILKRNGFQRGAPLPDNVDTLYALTMEK